MQCQFYIYTYKIVVQVIKKLSDMTSCNHNTGGNLLAVIAFNAHGRAFERNKYQMLPLYIPTHYAQYYFDHLDKLKRGIQHGLYI